MGDFSIDKVNKRCIHHYVFVLPDRYLKIRYDIASVVALTMAYLANNILNSKGRLDKSVYLGFAGLCLSLFYLFCARVEKRVFNKRLNKLPDYDKKIAIARRRYGSNSLELAEKYSEALEHLHESENYAKGKRYVEKILEIITSLGLVDDCGAEMYYKLSSFYFAQKKLYKALEYAKKSLDLHRSKSNHLDSKKLSDHFLEICCSINRLENKVKECESRLNCDLKKELQKDDNTLEASSDYFMQGSIAIKDNNLDKAIEFFKKSLKIRKNLLGDDNVLVANCCRMLGVCYRNKEKFEDAEKYLYEEALIVFEKHNDRGGICRTYLGLGMLYSMTKKENLSIDYFNKTLRELKTVVDDKFNKEGIRVVAFLRLIHLYSFRKDGEMLFKYIEEFKKVKKDLTDNDRYWIMNNCGRFFFHLLRDGKPHLFCDDKSEVKEEICKYGESFISMFEQQEVGLKKFYEEKVEGRSRRPPYKSLCLVVANVCSVLGRKKNRDADFENAIFYYKKCLEIIRVEELDFKQDLIYGRLGDLFFKKYKENSEKSINLNKALLNYKEGLEHAKKGLGHAKKALLVVIHFYKLMAIVYFKKKNYENSVKYFKKALKMWKDNKGKDIIDLDEQYIKNLEEWLQYVQRKNDTTIPQIITDEPTTFDEDLF